MSATTATPQYNSVGQAQDDKKDLFSVTKGKMKVQQRMIDLTARELESTLVSSQSIPSDGTTGHSDTLKENIVLVEVHHTHLTLINKPLAILLSPTSPLAIMH